MRHNQPKDFQIGREEQRPGSLPVSNPAPDPSSVQGSTPAPEPEPATKNTSQTQPKAPPPRAFEANFAVGLTFLPLIKMLFDNREHIPLKNIPAAFLTTLISTSALPLQLASDMIYKGRIRNTEIDPEPIFVLGHWRSGTTYLHELLASDNQHISPNGYQCFVPSHFPISERILRPVIGFFLPNKRPMDDMVLSLDRPQEEEFAMFHLTGRSTYGWSVFPAKGPVDLDYLTLKNIDNDDRARWIDKWIKFLQSVTYKVGPGKKLVLKTPQHTARIASILEVFPNAKFVHIARNPYTVYQSTLRTWRALSDMHGSNNGPLINPWIEESVLETGEAMYQAYEDDRALIPDGNLVELNYEDFILDPKSHLREIYETLNLGDFAKAEPAIDARLKESRSYKTGTPTDLPENADELAERWSTYFRLFGYGDLAKKALAEDQKVGTNRHQPRSPQAD